MDGNFQNALKNHTLTIGDLDTLVQNSKDENLKKVVFIVNSLIKSRVQSMNASQDIPAMSFTYMYAIGAVIKTYQGIDSVYLGEIGDFLINRAKGAMDVHFQATHGMDGSLEWQAIHRIEAILQKLQMR